MTEEMIPNTTPTTDADETVVDETATPTPAVDETTDGTDGVDASAENA